MKESLLSTLRKLRLSGLAQTLEVRLQEAASHNLNHAEFLELILQDELSVRSERLTDRRVKAAGFRELKPLADFEWSFNPSIKKKQVYDLACCRFIRERRDVLWMGPPGVGKSFLVQALAYEAIKQGFVVLYRSIFDVVRDFLHDEAFGGEERILAKYLKPDLLIIDDMGMKQLPKRSGEYLFEIIMRRYETRSTMMTSNRPLEDWGKLIGDIPSATAILDRFLHHAEIVTITGRSYRGGPRPRPTPNTDSPRNKKTPCRDNPAGGNAGLESSASGPGRRGCGTDRLWAERRSRPPAPCRCNRIHSRCVVAAPKSLARRRSPCGGCSAHHRRGMQYALRSTCRLDPARTDRPRRGGSPPQKHCAGWGAARGSQKVAHGWLSRIGSSWFSILLFRSGQPDCENRNRRKSLRQSKFRRQNEGEKNATIRVVSVTVHESR